MQTLIRSRDYDPANDARPEPPGMGATAADYDRMIAAILAHDHVADRVRAALAYVSPRAVVYGPGYRRSVAERYLRAVVAIDSGDWSVAARESAGALAFAGQLYGAATWEHMEALALKIRHGAE